MDYLTQSEAIYHTQTQSIEEIFREHNLIIIGIYDEDDEPPLEIYDDPTNFGEEF